MLAKGEVMLLKRRGTMTKNEAIEVLIQHAKRCPDADSENYLEWKERYDKVNEAVMVLELLTSLMTQEKNAGPVVKRKYYDITLDGKIVATRFAWNSAVRAVAQLVRERCRSLGTLEFYNLIAVTTDRSSTDKYTIVDGLVTWQSSTETLHFVITLRP